MPGMKDAICVKLAPVHLDIFRGGAAQGGPLNLMPMRRPETFNMGNLGRDFNPALLAAAFAASRAGSWIGEKARATLGKIKNKTESAWEKTKTKMGIGEKAKALREQKAMEELQAARDIQKDLNATEAMREKAAQTEATITKRYPEKAQALEATNKAPFNPEHASLRPVSDASTVPNARQGLAEASNTTKMAKTTVAGSKTAAALTDAAKVAEEGSAATKLGAILKPLKILGPVTAIAGAAYDGFNSGEDQRKHGPRKGGLPAYLMDKAKSIEAKAIQQEKSGNTGSALLSSSTAAVMGYARDNFGVIVLDETWGAIATGYTQMTKGDGFLNKTLGALSIVGSPFTGVGRGSGRWAARVEEKTGFATAVGETIGGWIYGNGDSPADAARIRKENEEKIAKAVQTAIQKRLAMSDDKDAAMRDRFDRYHGRNPVYAAAISAAAKKGMTPPLKSPEKEQAGVGAAALQLPSASSPTPGQAEARPTVAKITSLPRESELDVQNGTSKRQEIAARTI